MIFILGFTFGIIIYSSVTHEFKCCQEQNYLNNAFAARQQPFDSNSLSSRISMQRNLVIAAAIQTDLTTMYRFTRSVRMSCPLSAIVMLVENSTTNDKDFQDLANLYSVIYISIEEYFPARLKQNQALFQSIYSSRWITIRNYLSTLPTKKQSYDNVFICDAHDTLFQTDIFIHINDLTPGLYVFQEDAYMTIGKCSLNTDWMRTCYSQAEVTKLSERPILCSGTVLGTWKAIRIYLSVMESEILSTPINCTSFSGSDQGIHNYIIHNNKIRNVPVHQISNEYGFVATMGFTLSMKRNQFGLVQNDNGTVYAVIHQWNRSEQMKAQFRREYQTIPETDRNKKN